MVEFQTVTPAVEPKKRDRSAVTRVAQGRKWGHRFITARSNAVPNKQSKALFIEGHEGVIIFFI